jgi:hypothetical protein
MKNKLEKILESVGMILIIGFGLYILSLGFRFLWEAAKVIFK